eukprot:Awhi_evm1s7702
MRPFQSKSCASFDDSLSIKSTNSNSSSKSTKSRLRLLKHSLHNRKNAVTGNLINETDMVDQLPISKNNNNSTSNNNNSNNNKSFDRKNSITTSLVNELGLAESNNTFTNTTTAPTIAVSIPTRRDLNAQVSARTANNNNNTNNSNNGGNDVMHTNVRDTMIHEMSDSFSPSATRFSHSCDAFFMHTGENKYSSTQIIEPPKQSNPIQREMTVKKYKGQDFGVGFATVDSNVFIVFVKSHQFIKRSLLSGEMRSNSDTAVFQDILDCGPANEYSDDEYDSRLKESESKSDSTSAEVYVQTPASRMGLTFGDEVVRVNGVSESTDCTLEIVDTKYIHITNATIPDPVSSTPTPTASTDFNQSGRKSSVLSLRSRRPSTPRASVNRARRGSSLFSSNLSPAPSPSQHRSKTKRAARASVPLSVGSSSSSSRNRSAQGSKPVASRRPSTPINAAVSRTMRSSPLASVSTPLNHIHNQLGRDHDDDNTINTELGNLQEPLSNLSATVTLDNFHLRMKSTDEWRKAFLEEMGFDLDDKTITKIVPFKKAWESGLRVGDMIIGVNGKSVLNSTESQILAMMKTEDIILTLAPKQLAELLVSGCNRLGLTSVNIDKIQFTDYEKNDYFIE